MIAISRTKISEKNSKEIRYILNVLVKLNTKHLGHGVKVGPGISKSKEVGLWDPLKSYSDMRASFNFRKRKSGKIPSPFIIEFLLMILKLVATLFSQILMHILLNLRFK